ncbi:hypothetical protein [Amycolatopsis kentuckyensis]|uniref:hypothetical protein n=1 Tax=Amycolatopsis kentuckyensis TaxID=218823 RepID=UPI0035670438
MSSSKWAWPVPAAIQRRAPAPAGAAPSVAPDADPWAAFDMSEKDAERIGLAPVREHGSPAARARWLLIYRPLTAFEEWESARLYLEGTQDGEVPGWERKAVQELFDELSKHFEPRGGYFAFLARHGL